MLTFTQLGTGTEDAGNYSVCASVYSPGVWTYGDCGDKPKDISWTIDQCWARAEYRLPGGSGSTDMPLQDRCKTKYGAEIQKTIDAVIPLYQQKLAERKAEADAERGRNLWIDPTNGKCPVSYKLEPTCVGKNAPQRCHNINDTSVGGNTYPCSTQAPTSFWQKWKWPLIGAATVGAVGAVVLVARK